MSQLAKRLSYFAGGVVVFSAVTVVLASSVTYKPWGVPDSRRAEYEAKVAAMRQRTEIQKNLTDAAQPIASFDKTTHDFGRIDPHTTHSHAFKLSNTGTDPLSVGLQQTSCKCTIGDLAQSLLLPGESTEIKLTWNTGYKADSYEQTATLTTNDPVNKTIVLTVKGNVRTELSMPEEAPFMKGEIGQPASSSIVLYSQIWDDFAVEGVDCDLEGLEWVAEPVSLSDPLLADREPTSAWSIRFECTPSNSGSYSAEAKVTIRPSTGGEAVERVVKLSGKTSASIGFHSPEMHMHNGLDIGTLTSDKRHEIAVAVLVRNDKSRNIDVLDVRPKELEVSVSKTPREGVHRLIIAIPKDCPTVAFNRDDHHGYVQVGDPDDKDFENWFPLYGAVVRIED